MNKKQNPLNSYSSLKSWNDYILDLPTFEGVSLRYETQIESNKSLQERDVDHYSFNLLSTKTTFLTRWNHQLGSHINNELVLVEENLSEDTKINGRGSNRRSKSKTTNLLKGNYTIDFSDILSLDFANFSTQIKYQSRNSIFGISSLFRLKKNIAVGFEFIVSPTLSTSHAYGGIRYTTKDKEEAYWISDSGTLSACYTSKLTKGLQVASKCELDLYSTEINACLGFQLNTDKIWGFLKKTQPRSTNWWLSATRTKETGLFNKKSRFFDHYYGFLPLKKKNLINFSIDIKKNWSLLLSNQFSKKIGVVLSYSNKNNSSWPDPEFGIQFNYTN
ncbi:import receptor subunit tom40 [Anaeramoeba flamelloides]|uniref:Import receptor subunit tom40 n=1 Tax=Anaeramoeba flamelloides TaxID=1746091 RepID=A0ABQ8X5S6_9EUKA|nr:import receptor subunit tom40 [Anaeramoeba flamelloides]